MLLPCNHCDYIGCLPGYVLLCIGKWTASNGYTHISTRRCQRCILFPVLGIILSVVSFPLLIHEQLDQNANNSVKNVMISSFTPNYPKGTRHSPFSNKWIKMNMKFPKISHKHIFPIKQTSTEDIKSVKNGKNGVRLRGHKLRKKLKSKIVPEISNFLQIWIKCSFIFLLIIKATSRVILVWNIEWRIYSVKYGRDAGWRDSKYCWTKNQCSQWRNSITRETKIYSYFSH